MFNIFRSIVKFAAGGEIIATSYADGGAIPEGSTPVAQAAVTVDPSEKAPPAKLVPAVTQEETIPSNQIDTVATVVFEGEETPTCDEYDNTAFEDGGSIDDKISLTYIRQDDNGRLLYKGTDGHMYVEVEGVIHDMTDAGEPDTPVYNVRVKHGEPIYNPDDRFARNVGSKRQNDFHYDFYFTIKGGTIKNTEDYGRKLDTENIKYDIAFEHDENHIYSIYILDDEESMIKAMDIARSMGMNIISNNEMAEGGVVKGTFISKDLENNKKNLLNSKHKEINKVDDKGFNVYMIVIGVDDYYFYNNEKDRDADYDLAVKMFGIHSDVILKYPEFDVKITFNKAENRWEGTYKAIPNKPISKERQNKLKKWALSKEVLIELYENDYGKPNGGVGSFNDEYDTDDYEDARNAIEGEFSNERIEEAFTKADVEKLAVIVHKLREKDIEPIDVWQNNQVQDYLTNLSAAYKNKKSGKKKYATGGNIIKRQADQLKAGGKAKSKKKSRFESGQSYIDEQLDASALKLYKKLYKDCTVDEKEAAKADYDANKQLFAVYVSTEKGVGEYVKQTYDFYEAEHMAEQEFKKLKKHKGYFEVKVENMNDETISRRWGRD